MDVTPRMRDQDHPHHAMTDDAQRMTPVSELLEQLTGFVRRQRPILIAVPACAFALGFGYLLATPPQYTAVTTLLIDNSKMRVLQPQQQSLGDTPVDTAQVESQVEVLKSARISLAVIRALNLTEDAEFVRGGTGLLRSLMGLVSSSDEASRSRSAIEQKALAVFASRRSIVRIGKTYVLDVAFTSLSPDRAAEIANAIAEAYIDDQLEAKYQATRRASAWLQDRINELKAQALAADSAVLVYKEKNKIVDVESVGVPTGPGRLGRLIGDQQLAELNTQLIHARVATGEAQARLERIEAILKLDISEATVSDSLKNDVITRLRNQYLDLAAREASWSARYGKDHLAGVKLREEMEELRRSISNEFNRIAASYRSDYEIAKLREENLKRALANLVSEGQLTNRDRLGLAELESNAKTYHAAYESFLQRYMEAIQQQSFPIAEARVINSAAPPTEKSRPIVSLTLAIAGSLGFMLGLGIAALREATDAVFRSPRQVEEALAVTCLSVIPAMKRASGNSGTADYFQSAREMIPPAGLGQIARTMEAPTLETRCFSLTDPLMQRVIAEPLSAYAEGIRAIKVAAEVRAALRETKVIGVTSTVPNEGKSTIACNLAELMADVGKRVILVDADLRKPTLARCLEPTPTAGLMEALSGKMDLTQTIGLDRRTGLSFLPAVLDKRLIHSDEVVTSQAFRDVIDQLRQRYDYIIMDLPPIFPIVDLRAAAPLIDSFIFVVEWGSTRIKIVQRCLVSAPEVYDRLLGAVLNKADFKALAKFDERKTYDSTYYRTGMIRD